MVNSTIGSTQDNPSIAYLGNDNYVVVWTDNSGQDGNAQGVFARVYDSNDNPLAPEFQVNTTFASTQWQPTVVALQGGGFTVAWAGYNQIGSTGYDVVGRTFDNTGAATSAEFVINNPAAIYANYDQSQPTLAALQNGGFVAVWYGVYDQSSNSPYQIWGQRFDNAGAKDGDVFSVNTSAGYEGYEQSAPSITTLADGRFVVVWQSYAEDGSSYGVYGQRFNADGSKDGTEFRANTYTANGQRQPDVAALNDGGYVVVWSSDSYQDTDGWGVYGQRYDSAGNAVGGEFRVNYSVSGNQSLPAVAALANGGFAVSWTNGDEILFQQYDAAGRKVDSEQLVNPTANNEYSNDSDLVGTPDGGFILTWGGYNYGNATYDVFLQRYNNQAPQVQDVSVVGPEDAPIILSDDLFASGFFDAEGQTLAAIKIVTLPASGILKLDGVAVTPGQVISVADLAADKLTYQGNLNFYGADQFRWNGSDGNVFATTSVFTNITINNVNDGPALEAGAGQTANEGAYFTHTITIGDPDPSDVHLVTVSWVGSGGQTGGYSFTTGAGNPALGLTPPDDGTYTVTVTANDQQGQANSIETDSFDVTVNNVAPTLPYLSGNSTVEQGQVYTLDLSGPSDWGPVYDPGTDTVTEYRIDWGDSTAVQIIAAGSLPANGQVTHTYATAGTPTIRIALVDEDGTHADAGTKSITVAPPAEVIVVDAGADASIDEGTLFSRIISFTDPADQDPAGRNVTVDWGDGSGAENFRISTGQTSFNIQHVFADNRTTPYTVTVTVDDDGFQSDADSFDVTVNNVAPSLSLGGNGSTPEGAVYTLVLGSVVDPGNDSVSSYVVHWGDGNTQSFLPSDLLPSREVHHVYNDGDVSGTSRTITVDLVDEDGTHANVAGKSITVTNVAPGVPLSGADSVSEGTAYVLNVGAAVDPGVDTPTLYRIDWGDGSPATDFTPTNYANLLAAGGNVSHTYADGAASGTPRTIVMQVLDEDGPHNAGSKAVTVNNVAPTIALGGGASVDEGATYTLTLGAVSDPGVDSVTSYVVHWGDGTSDTYGAAGDVTHVYADGLSSPTITVDLVDEDGTYINAGSKAVTVNNVAPTIALGGGASVDEGATYTLTLGAVSDPGVDSVTSYVVHWGDGTSDTYGAAGDVTHVYADGLSSPTITVDLVDEDGTHINAGSKAVTVNNVAPTIALGGGASVDEGATYTLTLGAVSDPGSDSVTSYVVHWGDGTSDTYGAAGDVTHVYADGLSSPTITVDLVDEDGTHINAGSKAVTVNNVAPTIALGGGASVDEGATYTLTLGAVSDPGVDSVTSYVVHWGDGTSDTYGAAGDVTHVYADGLSSPTITVDLVDEDGTYINAGSKAVTVNNVAPTIALGGGASVDEGATYTLTLGAVSDPGVDSVTSYVVHWGDGTSDTYGAAGDVTHVYADGLSSPTITVDLVDEDGTYINAGSKAVTVNNVAPTIALGGGASVDEGATYTLTLGAVSDPGVDSVTSYVVHWGDGTSDTYGAAGDVTHVYADGLSSPTITVDLVDEDGTHINAGSKAVTVNNVAPTIALSGAANVVEDTVYTLNLGSITDPGSDTVTSYVVHWGDGTDDTYAAGGDVTHTYADPGNYPISVDVVDEDGTHTAAGGTSVTVDAASATLSINAGADATLSEGDTFTRSIAFGDGSDDGAAGWSYGIDYGDGSAPVTGTTLTKSLDLSHVYADGSDSHTVTVTLTDEVGETASDSFLVTVNNVAPTIALGGGASVDEGATYTLTLGAVSDPGVDSVTSYVVHWGDGTSDTYGAAGDVTHVYADGLSSPTITVDLVDEDGTYINAGSKAVTVNNVAPTIALGGGASVDEGATYTLTLGAVSDPGVDSVTSYVVHWGDGTSDTYGAAGDVTHVYADGLSSPTITVDLVDEDGTHINAGSKAVTVNNVAPTIALSGAANVVEDTVYTLNLGSITDPGSDTVTSYVVHWGDGTDDTYAAGGDVTHTYADPGNYPISVGVVDEDGTFIGVANKAVTVNATGGGNTAPVADDESYSMRPGETLNIAAPGVLDGDTDADGDPLSLLSVNVTGLQGSLAPQLDGSFSFTPNAGFSGQTSFSYTVGDGFGGTDTGTVTIDVINTAPVADDESYSMRPGETLNIAAPGVLDGDTDADGDPLSLLSVNVTGLQGSLAPQLDGSFSFTPNAGFSGQTSFSYTVGDGFGGTDTGTVTIDVINTAPVADDESYSMRPGETLNIAAPGVLDGDTDADGDPLSLLSVNVTGLQGSLAPQLDGSFSFTPNAGFSGQTSFSYTVGDGFGGTDTGTVTIDVINTAPVADDESYSMRPGETLTIAAPGVLDGDTDADGDPLSLLSVNVTGLQGSLAPQLDGSFSFTPNAGFSGQTSFSYTVGDGFGGTDTGTVTIDVINTAPVADDESYSMRPGETLTIAAPGVLDGDTDADGDPLSLLSVNVTGLQGSLAPQLDGSFSFTPNAGFSGQTSFSYTVGDGFGGTDTGTVTIDVINTAPVADDESYSMRPGETLNIAAPGVLDGDTDADGDPLSVVGVNVTGLQGTLVALADGSFSFTPNAGFSGQTSFSYTVGDGFGGFAGGTVTIDVINTDPVADDESYSMRPGETLNIAAPGVLDGDTDADGDPLSVVGVNVTGLQGTLVALADGSFSFTPDAGFTGQTSFSYTVGDGFGGFGTAIVTIDVAPATPTLALDAGPDDSVNEGDTFNRTIVFTDGQDDGALGWNYSIDYGDGSVPVTGNTFLASLTLDHRYADGDASHSVSITITDEPGETVSDGFQLTVSNVAPVIALSGAATVAEDTAYTLNLGAVSDPGVDTASSYVVHWGDGSDSSYPTQGDVTHTYANPGSYAITVDVADEDGVHASAGQLAVQVNPVLHLGNAVARLTSAAPDAWVTAWSAPQVTIAHKADWDDAGETWSAVKLQNGSPVTLSGTDVYLGDLGVSGQTAPTSVIRQEIDGSEGLRLLLDRDASRATLDLSNLNLNDDGLAGAVEAGRLQAFDSLGNLVGEVLFDGANAAGTQEVTLSSAAGFRSLVLTSGAYDGANFVDGAYVDGAGDFASAPFSSGGKLHGSEFLVDAVEFELIQLVGVGSSAGGSLIT
ncbi:MAG: cadherin-like domain-containing protein [Accumulibacter sp.]|uniref:cadherin-like domain-containing protein n=1 Tax=Accumulibacter sp. TaxID=2053492 RepID=UPI002FC3CD04